MSGTEQKSYKWVWVVIIAAVVLGALVTLGVVISFVIFFSPDPRQPKLSPNRVALIHGRPVTINGVPITNEEFDLAYKETLLAWFMRTGGREWPAADEATQENLRRDSVFRVFLNQKIRSMGIRIKDEVVAQAIKERLGSYPLTSFQVEYLSPRGLTTQDFERFLKTELAIKQLMNDVTATLVTFKPGEAEDLFRKERQELDVRLAVFWTSNYLGQISVHPDELANYFTNHMADYRVPARVIVKYVEFPALNYLAEAEQQLARMSNFNARLDEAYLKAGPGTFKDPKGAVLSEADAKKKIKDDFRKQVALLEAARKASEFGNELYNLQAENPENLDKVAAQKNLLVKTSLPLERNGSEGDQEYPAEFRAKAFTLNATTPILYQPVRGEKAVYVMALVTNLPSEIPAFEKVQNKVRNDYLRTKALALSWSAGRDFHSLLTNRLAQKQPFEMICSEAKVPCITVPRFSLASTSLTNLDPRIELKALQLVAADLKPGEVSRFTPAPKQAGGFILYLKEQLPLDDAMMKQDFPKYLESLRTFRQHEAFNAWFRKQAEASKLYIAPPDSGADPAATNTSRVRITGNRIMF